jgi:hypothetical protein
MRAVGGRILRLRPDTQYRVEDADVVRAGPQGHGDHDAAGSDSSVSPRATCAVCGAAARDAALDGWHVFEDPSGDEHLVCRACLSDG